MERLVLVWMVLLGHSLLKGFSICEKRILGKDYTTFMIRGVVYNRKGVQLDDLSLLSQLHVNAILVQFDAAEIGYDAFLNAAVENGIYVWFQGMEFSNMVAKHDATMGVLLPSSMNDTMIKNVRQQIGMDKLIAMNQVGKENKSGVDVINVEVNLHNKLEIEENEPLPWMVTGYKVSVKKKSVWNVLQHMDLLLKNFENTQKEHAKYTVGGFLFNMVREPELFQYEKSMELFDVSKENTVMPLDLVKSVTALWKTPFKTRYIAYCKEYATLAFENTRGVHPGDQLVCDTGVHHEMHDVDMVYDQNCIRDATQIGCDATQLGCRYCNVKKKHMYLKCDHIEGTGTKLCINKNSTFGVDMYYDRDCTIQPGVGCDVLQFGCRYCKLDANDAKSRLLTCPTAVPTMLQYNPTIVKAESDNTCDAGEGNNQAGISMYFDTTCIDNGGLGCDGARPGCKFCMMKDSGKSGPYVPCPEPVECDELTLPPITTTPKLPPIVTINCTASEKQVADGIAMTYDANCLLTTNSIDCNQTTGCRYCQVFSSRQSKEYTLCKTTSLSEQKNSTSFENAATNQMPTVLTILAFLYSSLIL